MDVLPYRACMSSVHNHSNVGLRFEHQLGNDKSATSIITEQHIIDNVESVCLWLRNMHGRRFVFKIGDDEWPRARLAGVGAELRKVVAPLATGGIAPG